MMHPLNGYNILKLFIHTLFFNLFFLNLFFQDCSDAAGSSVKFLPGFNGPLPFELETGYIGVGESEDVQLFYYFVQSESNPAEDPLFLWLTGGPGCSSLTGLVYEIGPIMFGPEQDYQSLPKLVLNPYSWTKVASIIFLDLPVGTGFSYARNKKAAHSDVEQSSDQAYEFLRKWLVKHPQFLSNQFYVAGDSYSGLPVPVITRRISDGNDIGLEPKIDMKGYLLGNPLTIHPAENDYIVPYAHGMGLISDELFESLKEACSGIYHDIHPENSLCLENMKTFNELLHDINTRHILEPSCPSEEPRSIKLLCETRTMYEKYQSDLLNLEIRKEDGSPIKCRYETYKLSILWANDKIVQEAIHIRKGTFGVWNRCNHNIPFNISITNTVPYHAYLSNKGYKSLIYSGDHDMLVSFVSTTTWIRSLNYSIVDDWRPWIVDGQVAGYTRTYANNMTFATVKGAGHTAPEYKPRECRVMFEKWISYQPL